MRLLLTISFLLLGVFVFAQKKQEVLRTNIKTFPMKVLGEDPRTVRTWSISPAVKPDTYSTTGKQVRFITDIDSITVNVSKKNPIYDFIVIYNNTDTCYTRIQFEILPDHLGKLKKAKKYNLTDNRTVPEFTYQDMNDPNLVALRKKYNLDSIAGDAGEIHQMLNLMHWIHNLVEHDGQHGNPEHMNADEMIKACSDGSRGLNCRGLGISLNECFLALGFKSRYVTCMPKELEFDDCHVINTVYSWDLKKWIYLDPTNDAYVMDEKGTLLSVQEVRERLINGKPLLLNPGANWNNVQPVFADDYLYFYMAKNLYRLECPVSSQYNYETPIAGKNAVYIELLPLDGINQTPQKSDIKMKDVDFTFTKYVTNNPNLFWKAPKLDIDRTLE
jgi:hypothetical protein